METATTKYDIPKYIAKIKMSAKKRILVEGPDDRAHIKNLLSVLLDKHNVKIDVAQNIKGNCKLTAKNCKARIEKIYNTCKLQNQYSNLYFLCDREFYKFEIGDNILDLMLTHENEGNLNWTLGHSLENYFLDPKIVCDAYRFLSGSEFKNQAVNLFEDIMPSAIKIIAALTLAAKDINKSSYPIGMVDWSDFEIKGNELILDVNNWKSENDTLLLKDLKNRYSYYLPIVDLADELTCARLSRGHTAIALLQRAFAKCISHCGEPIDSALAIRDANAFSKLKEISVSNALCEAWLRTINNGNENYPKNLIESVA